MGSTVANGVSRGCFTSVSRVFRRCFAGVLQVSHRVFREFRGCLAAVSQLFRAVSQQIRTVNLCKKPVALRYLEAKRSTLQPRRMASTHGLDASTLTEHGVTVYPPSRYLDASSTLQPRRGLDARLDAASTARRQGSAQLL